LTKSQQIPLHPDLAAPEHLPAWIASQLPTGASLIDLTLFCTSDLPERVLCLLRLDNVMVGEIAHALRGQAFGFDSIVVSLPVAGRFSCRHRQPGAQFELRSCTCTLGAPPPRSWLDFD